ncbi:MAG: DUF47 family protein [Clostridiales bacterium]|nr:DUF47 family protein [Clostridiales bacterium]
MAKKQDQYYDIFVEMSDFSCAAAVFLREMLGDFHPEMLGDALEKMHKIEHGGDMARHGMTKMLAKEFITPIEREDIMAMSEAIDTVTDKIEDAMQRLYMYDMKTVRDDAVLLADVIVKCTEAMREALTEFCNFKKSKIIADRLIEINRLEEVGDRLFIDAVRGIFVDEQIEAKQRLAWNSIYGYMEDVCDACEDVADVIEGVIMKNT